MPVNDTFEVCSFTSPILLEAANSIQVQEPRTAFWAGEWGGRVGKWELRAAEAREQGTADTGLWCWLYRGQSRLTNPLSSPAGGQVQVLWVRQS